MESIREIYRIGRGPSSSHTMGPLKAAEAYRARTPDASAYRVTLYGSLAATGRGHLADKAVADGLAPARLEIIWEPEKFLEFRPNALRFEVTEGAPAAPWTAYSTGGGRVSDGTQSGAPEIYSMNSMEEVLAWSRKTGRTLWEYVAETEGPGIFPYMAEVWTAMQDCLRRGLEAEGALPAVLYRIKESQGLSDVKIHRALLTAGLFGNLVEKNASISGAEVGCQGEVGTACAMAAAAATQLLGGSERQIEYAAEMGMEHHLGLTCDPIGGLVQAPCIERNAFAAEEAMNAATFSLLGDGGHLVSFDKVVRAMNQTGHDLPRIYKETSEGGLASMAYDEN